MLVMQILLPRFLVIELVLFVHFVPQVRGCKPASLSDKFKQFIGVTEIRDEDVDEGDLFDIDTSGCVINLNGSVRYQPLFLVPEGGEFLLPVSNDEDSGMDLVLEGEVVVACPQAKLPNHDNVKVIEIECKNETNTESPQLVKKSDPSEIVESSSLGCSRSIRESIQELKDTCGPNDATGHTVQIGWKINDVFHPQFTVCHDKDLEHTFYSSHDVQGAAIEFRSKESSRPGFKEGGRRYYAKSKAGDAYKITSQKKLFLDEFNITNTFLAKGHLSPDADFVFEEWQDATYYFFNTAPQWQSINNGNWKVLEGEVRKLAQSKGITLAVHTGTFGKLKMDMVNSVALGKEGTIPVPLYFWKLVSDPVSNETIAFVSVNHPRLDDVIDEDAEAIPAEFDLCPSESRDLCEEGQWPLSNRLDFNRGLIYCCSYDQLKLSIPWLPDLKSVSLAQEILMGNGIEEVEPKVESCYKPDPSLQGCSLKLDHSVKNHPMIVESGSNKVILPTKRDENGTVDYFVSESMFTSITCPQARLSKFGEGKENQVAVSCRMEDMKVVSAEDPSQVVEPSSLSCSRSIRETVQELTDTCGPSNAKGHIVQIGWKLQGVFQPQISLCHDKDQEHTFYASHKLNGASIEFRSKESSRPGFKEGGRRYYAKSKAEDAYKIENQEKQFLNSYGINTTFLAKGHLAPDADFVLEEWQDATYYFFNAAPQWQSYNNGNWKAVEAAVRKLSSKRCQSLDVVTGTFGKLSLDGINPLALGKSGTIPVPLIFWKLVSDVEANETIAFVSVNHPLLEETIIEDPGLAESLDLCPPDSESLCEEAGWPLTRRKYLSKGAIYCCTYDELKKSIPWLPGLEGQVVDPDSGPPVGVLQYK